MGVIILSKKIGSKKIGIIIASVGVGITLAIVIPFWMWIIAAGLGLIAGGCYLINKHR
jgi:hypothetical protein